MANTIAISEESSLFQDLRPCFSPFAHLLGQLNPAIVRQLLGAQAEPAADALCSYGSGQRRQQPATIAIDTTDARHPLAAHPAIRALAIEHSQRALGCDLTGQPIQINVRHCVDESDYFLSPHEDCPKTICAILIYLWNGERGTSLYRLTHHMELPPAPEPGLRERVNNFHHHPEFQRGNLDVITLLYPNCYATYEHVKLIRPRLGSFLLIPNTRFRGALPDLPRSHHGVASCPMDQDAPERRHLLLMDLKLADGTPPSLRSCLKARLSRTFR
jgi:hypothetical protein